MSTEAKAILRSARISAQKARLVADLVRGMPVGRASDVLAFTNKKAAHLVRKVLLSAVANTVDVLLIARFLIGVAIGVASMLTPLYLAEISPANVRGAIV